MLNKSSDFRSSDAGTGGASQHQHSGFHGLLNGAAPVLAVLFAVTGVAQIGLAAFFLARGHPAWVVPQKQPEQELSFVLEGWLPLGACGVIMVVLAWVTLRFGRSIHRKAGSHNDGGSRGRMTRL
jgi:hypothetical protein